MLNNIIMSSQASFHVRARRPAASSSVTGAITCGVPAAAAAAASPPSSSPKKCGGEMGLAGWPSASTMDTNYLHVAHHVVYSSTYTIWTAYGRRVPKLWFHARPSTSPQHGPLVPRTLSCPCPRWRMQMQARSSRPVPPWCQHSAHEHPRRPGGHQAPTPILITYAPDAKLGGC